MFGVDLFAAVLEAAAPLLLLLVVAGELGVVLREERRRARLHWAQALAFVATGGVTLLYHEVGFDGWFHAHPLLVGSALLVLPLRPALAAAVGLVVPNMLLPHFSWTAVAKETVPALLLGGWVLVARYSPLLRRWREQPGVPWRWALVVAVVGALLKLLWANIYILYQVPIEWRQSYGFGQLVSVGLGQGSLASFGLSVAGLFSFAVLYLSAQAWDNQAQSLLRYRTKSMALLGMMPDTALLWDGAYCVKSVWTYGTPLSQALPAEQLPGKHLADLLPRDSLAETMDLLARVQQTGQSFTQVVTYDQGDGRLRHLELRWQPYQHNQVLSLVRDITDAVLLRQQQTQHSAKVLDARSTLPDLSGLWGPARGTRWLSASALLRFTQGQGLVQLEDLLAPEDLPRVRGALEQAHREPSFSLTLTCSVGTRVGVRAFMELTFSHVTPPGGQEDAAVLFVGKDVTQEYEDKRRIQLGLQAFNSAGIAMALIDEEEGRISWASQHFFALTGYSADEAVGQPLDKILRSTASHGPMPTTLELALHQPWRGRFNSRTQSGAWLQEWREVTFFEDAETRKVFHVVTLYPTDLPVGQGLSAVCEQSATPSLPSAQDFLAQAQPVLAERRREAAVVAVLGAYGWESLHRSRGAEAIDNVMAHARSRLLALDRPPAAVVRIASDRLALLVIGEGARECAVQAERLTDAANNPPWFDRTTLRMGYAQRTSLFQTAEQLLENATYAFDKACRPAAPAVVSHNADMESRQRAQKERQTRVTEVLKKEQPLDLRFEPVHRLKAVGLAGAMVRPMWHADFEDSNFALSSSGLLSSTEQADELSYQTLQHLCQQVQAWTRLGHPPLRTTMELDALQLMRRPFLERLAALPRAHNLFASHFVLEIHMEHAHAQYAAVSDALSFLRNKGFQVTLGSVGFSQSALSMLQSLPWTGFSLDQGLVRGLEGDSTLTEVCHSLMRRAAALNLSVVAKGVSSAQQVEVLHSLGCHAAYGPWMGSLVNSEELLALSEQQTSLG